VFRSLRTLRSIPRIKDIAFVLGKHGFHQVAGALQAPVPPRVRRLFRQEPAPIIQQPERLRLVLEDLGPTFIKFGQLLSTRPDMLPDAYLEELGKLRDEVHPSPFSEVREILDEEFEGRTDELFRSIDPEPLAAASIAQAHRAVTISGQRVVVKVRRRGLERIVEQDLLVLALLAEFLRGWQGIRLFDPQGLVRAFERSIRRELNFDYERANLERVRSLVGDNSHLYLPRPVAELSSKRVLTMEYLAGPQLSHVDETELSKEAREERARKIAFGVLQQVFEFGVYHADPHPGNIILMEDGRVGLIDLGNVGRILPEMMDDLVVLLVALVRRDYPGLARWILRQGRPTQDVDVQTLAGDLMDNLDQYYGLRLGEIRVGNLFHALFAMILRYGITVPPQYVMVGRTFMTLEGSVRLCAPDLEILSEIGPYATEVFGARWSPARVLRDVEKQATEIFSAVKDFPRNLAEVLDRTAAGRLRVEVHNPDLDKIERKLDTIATKMPIAMVVCALVVASALLFCLADPAQGRFPNVLGGIGLAVASFLGLRLLMR